MVGVSQSKDGGGRIKEEACLKTINTRSGRDIDLFEREAARSSIRASSGALIRLRTTMTRESLIKIAEHFGRAAWSWSSLD